MAHTKVRVGDTVTTLGRSGWGQPVVTGRLIAIRAGIGEIEIHPGITRKRSMRNIRPVKCPQEGVRP